MPSAGQHFVSLPGFGQRQDGAYLRAQFARVEQFREHVQSNSVHLGQKERDSAGMALHQILRLDGHHGYQPSFRFEHQQRAIAGFAANHINDGVDWIQTVLEAFLVVFDQLIRF
jgi:hypothetical protein